MANLKDYATSLVAIAPSPATSGTTLTVTTGEGSLFPATPFNATLHLATAIPTFSTAEKIQVTNVTGDVLTIVRAQGGTTAKTVAVGWRITNSLFAADIFDGTYGSLTGKPTLGSLASLNSVDLTSNVTGILPIANGGTGTSTGPDFTTDTLHVLKAGDTSTGQQIINLAASGTILDLQITGSSKFKVDAGTITTSLQFTGRNIVPQTSASYNIGTTGLYYSNSYITRLNLNSTAYFDGATAGNITTTAQLQITNATGPAMTLTVPTSASALTITTATGAVGDSVYMYMNGRARIGYFNGLIVIDDGRNNGVGASASKSFQMWLNGQHLINANQTGMSLGTGAVDATIPAPTHSLTLPSVATGIALYNTVDQTTNYERGLISWSSNILSITTQNGGTGIIRNINLTANGGSFTVGSTIVMNRSTTGIVDILDLTGTMSNSSGITVGINIKPTFNQTATAGYTALLINPTETATGSGAKLLIDAQVGGASKFTVDNSANIFSATNNTGSVGLPANYYATMYSNRYYLNSTAYLDGGTAGTIATSGSFGVNTVPLTTLHVQRANSTITFTPNGRTAAIFENNNTSGTVISVISNTTSGAYSGIWFGSPAGESLGQFKYVLSSNRYELGVAGSGAIYRLDSTGTWLGANSSTNTATHTMTLDSTATGIALYNTSDQTTNFERVRKYWSSNVFYINSENGGTGVSREIRLQSGGGAFFGVNNGAGTSTANPKLNINTGTSSTNYFAAVNGTSTLSTGLFTAFSVSPVINESGTGGYTALLVNPTETSVGSGAKLLADFQVGGTSKAYIRNDGGMFMTNQSTGIATRTAAVTLGITAAGTNLCDPTAGSFNVTLPSPTIAVGLTYFFKKIDGGANTVTIVGTIDGATNYVLSIPNKGVAVQTNGTAWYVVGIV
jgi:hypothetical protein